MLGRGCSGPAVCPSWAAYLGPAPKAWGRGVLGGVTGARGKAGLGHTRAKQTLPDPRWSGWSSACSWRRTRPSTYRSCLTTSLWVGACLPGPPDPQTQAPSHCPLPSSLRCPPPTLARTGKQGLALRVLFTNRPLTQAHPGPRSLPCRAGDTPCPTPAAPTPDLFLLPSDFPEPEPEPVGPHSQL